MPSISKFLFEIDFDDESAPNAPAAAPSTGSAKAPPPPPPVPREEHEAAISEAFARGLAQGRAETAQATEQDTRAALEAIVGQLSRLLSSTDQVREDSVRYGVDAASMIVRKMMPSLARQHGLAEIEDLIRDCLQRMTPEPRLLVRVADPLLDPLKARLDEVAAAQGYEGRFVLLADDNLSEGDAQVEWADGGVERNSAQLMQEIDVAVRRFLDDVHASAAAATGRNAMAG